MAESGGTVERLFVGSDSPPLMNAAGTVKTLQQVRDLLGAPIPAVVVGSYTVEARSGNDGGTFFESPLGGLNAMGFPGPDLVTWSKWVTEMATMLVDDNKELWVSVAGFNPPEYRRMAEVAFESGATVVEANLGCPNVWNEGKQHPIVSFSVEQVGLVLDELADVMATERVGVKLSPILDAVLLSSIDAMLAATNVAFITTMNTVPNCFAFTPNGDAAISFGRGLAGMSGPAVKWMGLGQVMAHRENLPSIPVVGVGGIMTGRDFADYLHPSVGASAGQVGTAFWQRGRRALIEVLAGFVDPSQSGRP